MYKNSTLKKIDQIDRLTRQIKISQDEIGRLCCSVEADLDNLQEKNLTSAFDAGNILLKAAVEGRLLISELNAVKVQEY